MKAKEVLKLLNITRPTLTKYVKTDKIRVIQLPNGQYDYHEEDVYKILHKTSHNKKNVIYARVSFPGQEEILNKQIEAIQNFCKKKGIIIDEVYKDIGPGIILERKDFIRLLEKVLNYEIGVIYVTYEDRLSRLSFPIIELIFNKFGVKIISIKKNDEIDENSDKEIIGELIKLIKKSSKEMKDNIKKEKLKLIEKDLNLWLKI